MDIEQILDDSRLEPEWRSAAAREADYYDGNQLDSDVLTTLDERGMQPVSRNLIGPAVDVVLGMEEKNRQDWKVVAADDPDTDEAIALTQELGEVERLSRADRAVSDAYARQIKCGVGWAEVGQNPDPFGYRHRCFAPRWQEMHWDWRSREPDLSDARYVWRRRWFDADLLAMMFRAKAGLINRLTKNWAVWDQDAMIGDNDDLARDWDTQARSSLDDDEWLDGERERLLLYEVWYRKYEWAQILRIPQAGLVVEFNERDERQRALVMNGSGELSHEIVPRMRLAYYIGPHQLLDQASPYAHNDFPYVPFFGLREERTGIPYGLIRRMMSPQDEVNSRITKMLWLLSAKRVIGDSDAFELAPRDLLEEVARPDAYLPLRPNRVNRTQIPKVETDRDLAAQQFQVLQDAQRAVPELAGIYQAMQGKQMEQQSGIAINSLVEQGATTLAEINGNYVLARKRVGELLLANRVNEMADRLFQISIKRGGQRKVVAFNRPVADARSGERRLDNALTLLKTRVELTDVPASPTYRAHMLNNLMELTKSLQPDQQALIIPMVIEATDLPQRDEIANLLRSAAGRGDDPLEVLKRERDQALSQQQRDQELQEQRAKTEETQAKTEKLQAETQAILVKLQHMVGAMAEQLALSQGTPGAPPGGAPPPNSAGPGDTGQAINEPASAGFFMPETNESAGPATRATSATP